MTPTTPDAKPRRRDGYPPEARWRLYIAGILLFLAWGTSNNPGGYITEAGAFSQGFFIVGFLQLFESLIAWLKTTKLAEN